MKNSFLRESALEGSLASLPPFPAATQRFQNREARRCPTGYAEHADDAVGLDAALDRSAVVSLSLRFSRVAPGLSCLDLVHLTSTYARPYYGEIGANLQQLFPKTSLYLHRLPILPGPSVKTDGMALETL
jgi:hypothetical protein